MGAADGLLPGLAPSSPTRRLAEVEAFALVAERGPIIAGGDWNALPASDPVPPGAVIMGADSESDHRAVIAEFDLARVAAHDQWHADSAGGAVVPS